jgi:transposase-like protein
MDKDNDNPFKWHHYQAEIILLNVRWYLRYQLSYRDLEEMMIERSLSVDHTTIYRWVQEYAPELDKRCRPHLKNLCNTTERRPLKRAFQPDLSGGLGEISL